MKIKQIIILTLLTIALQIYSANPRRYITQNGSGLMDGSSWENAGSSEQLQDILDTIEDADFWIAKGIYKPTKLRLYPESERDKVFGPNFNLIYGGFTGTETDLSQRDIKNNETIFSGDTGIEGDNTDNCYHVIKDIILIDGITICNGNANGLSAENSNYNGGGLNIWCNSSIIRNCTFRDNYASQNGGAVFMDVWGYDVVFENCLFRNNESEEGGSAIYSSYTTSIIIGCTFVKNTSNAGNCVSVPYRSNDDVLINNNIFWKNTGGDLGAENVPYSISHNAIEGGYEGFANINLSSENTGFKNSPYFTDPDHDDYSLQSLSPCIDAGVYWNTSSVTDITGILRPQGTACDIGAYEYNNGPLTTVLPSVSTLSTAFTTVSTARVRGNVTSDGGSQMITKGVYYSLTPSFDPATQGTLVKYNQLYNIGDFYFDITNLSPGTTYYYRIFCENRVGSAVGEEMSFTTRSGISPDANGILYVKTDGTGDGSSWANALHGNDLQLGINDNSVQQIWIAKGIYKPTSFPNGGSIERQKHFSLKHNLILYGGFTGTETALEQRDYKTNKTILSGDIGAENDYYDNTYHVFYHLDQPDIDSTSVIDGVTISDGGSYSIARANSDKGGGMYNDYASPTIRNCVFENNRARYGGGMYNSFKTDTGRSEPKVINTKILNNTASVSGGGIYDNGAAPYLENCVISDNTADVSGGGIYHHCEDYAVFGIQSYTKITQTTIAGNSAPDGSEIKFDIDYWNALILYNSIIWGSSISGPTDCVTSFFCGITEQSLNGDGNIILSNNNTGDINSPYFTDPENNDYSLLINSACKDMAMYRYCTETDIFGTARPQGAAYDMGAYEYITVEAAATGPALVTSYADSIRTSYAVCHVNVISDGGTPLWERGVAVSDSSGFDPATQGKRFFNKGNYTEPSYSVRVYDLKPSKTYYYVSYAENRMGISYGNEMSLTTSEITPDENGIVYIKTDGTGNGSSWSDALGGEDLQAAIDYPLTKQVWVAKGKYLPNSWPAAIDYHFLFSTPLEEREKHFALRDSIEVYGGFTGWETDIAERDIKNNETIFSGDIGIEGDHTDNCLHVFVNLPKLEFYYNIEGFKEQPPIVFDGFTVSDGYEDYFPNHYLNSGAGMYNYNFPLIRNCIFRNNRGGAITYDEIDSYRFVYTIENTVFDSNTKEIGGAAVGVDMTDVDFNFISCVFTNNTSEFGAGAIFISGGHYTISNCLFYNNRGYRYSVLYNNPIYLYIDDVRKITNCSFINNVSEINEYIINSGTYLDVANCVFYKNNCNGFWDSSPEILNISNCAFEENIDQPDHSGENNITISTNNSGDPNSPYFCDPDNSNWMIQELSPLRDAGIWTDDVPFYDIAGYLRDSLPDIGCYEYDPTSIDEDSALPRTTRLYQNYPNPFNPTTNIRFDLEKNAKVELSVYNVMGQLVDRLVNEKLKAGHHSVMFKADHLNSGVYYYTLETDVNILTRKMLIVK
ncbi:MAG: choice-of-anchor Q domain-containing protein [Candidatus Delongbacteria bacterium]